MSLAKSSAALAGADDADIVKKAEAVTREILENDRDNRLSSPQLAGQILREIKRLTGVSDPYKAFKAREMALALKIFAQIKNTLRNLSVRIKVPVNVQKKYRSEKIIKTVRLPTG